ncbi:MAG: OadG family protein [Lachnospiraceae bacterium]|nr:OadG family protein [Lachnospiraceae bacterium]
MKKRLVSFLSIIACLSLLFSVQVTGTAASAASQNGAESQYSADDFAFYTDPWIEGWFSGDFSSVQDFDSQYISNGLSVTYNFEADDYSELFEKAGAFEKYEDAECTSTEDTVTITRKALCKNRDVKFTFTHNLKDFTIAWTVEVESTPGEVVAKAGLNTLMGMGTVFCVLIFIIFIISLFGLFSLSGKKNEKTEKVKPEIVPQVQPAPQAPQEAAASDDEIIAVISAAIAAYEEEAEGEFVPADGLIVRSIKKRF